MTGIAILLDFLKKNPSPSVHSYTLFSATAAASAAAASVVAGRPFASRAIFGNGFFPVAHCDAGAAGAWEKEYIPSLQSASGSLFPDSFKYITKEYPVELKPLFSAFGIRSLGMTSLRSFLMFYLPLLEPRQPVEEDDLFPEEAPERQPVDLVTPFHKSVKQIIRETAVVTTRRVLERLAVYHVSRRTAWKLLKDVPRSAWRKSARGMPTILFSFSVSRTTFRGHCLGVAASWFVQIVIAIYQSFFKKQDDVEDIDINAKFRHFANKLYSTTVRCSASLVFASIGGGIGALIHPSFGQWIGCALGDFGGPIVAILILEKLHLEL